MYVLDIRTLSLITMLFSALFFLGLLTYAQYNKRFHSLKFFAYGDFLLFLGFLFLSLRNVIPDFLSVVAANFFIAVAFFLFYYGSVTFLRIITRFLWLHFTGLAALLALFVYFTFILPDVNARIIIINAFLFLESIIIALTFIVHSRIEFRIQKLSVVWGFLVYGVYSLFRIIWTIWEVQIDDFLEAGIVHGLIFILIQILLINTAFSLIWITNTILNYDLETQASLDHLTKTLNRRAFIDELEKEIARSKRESITFSLIMVDIDFFKNINDNFGHLAGDSVLLSFSHIVKENLRINDIFARYGGEEFMILLPHTEKKYAVETAERIRKIIESINHPFNGRDIKYTVSFGVSSFDMEAQNREELLENVDVALYEAKSKGRNRVAVK